MGARGEKARQDRNYRTESDRAEGERKPVKQGSERGFLVTVATIWVAAALTLFPHLSGAAGAANGDAERGKQLFEKDAPDAIRSTSNKEGPRLRGVYGRKAGTVADFSYSDELKAAHIMWDDQSLDRWLTNPDAVVSDNDMAFHVSNPQETSRHYSVSSTILGQIGFGANSIRAEMERRRQDGSGVLRAACTAAVRPAL